MVRILAKVLLIPAIAAISVAALAGRPQSNEAASRRPHRTHVVTVRPAVRPRIDPRAVRVQLTVRKLPPKPSAAIRLKRPVRLTVRKLPPKPSPAIRRQRPVRQAAAPAWQPPPRNPPSDRQDARPQPREYDRNGDSWNGRRYYYRGQPYWRIDIRLFPRYGLVVWRRGSWYQGWHGGRWGWWWLAGGAWYYYSAPVYPYPNPYVPGTVVVVTNPPPPPAYAQYWYYCNAPQGYYPYVPVCYGSWTPVPATPAPAPVPYPPGG